MSKKKILYVLQGGLFSSGVEVYLHNIFRYINHEIFECSFLVPTVWTNESFCEEISSAGGRVYELKCNQSKGWRIKRYLKLRRFLKMNFFDIVHVNGGSFTLLFSVALAAKRSGVPMRIVHSHNAVTYRKKHKYKLWAKNITKKLLTFTATDYFACSSKASEAIFEKKLILENKVVVMKNGIDIDKYLFNASERFRVRKELNLKNEFVLIQIGRFTNAKNHSFTLDILKHLVEHDNTIKLILIGDGELKTDIYQKVVDLKLIKNVIFIGLTNHIQAYLSAADLLIMPSLHEGFPMVGIEAQANGLQCLFSSEITSEINVTGKIEFLPLEIGAKQWAARICEGLKGYKRYELTKEKQLQVYDIRRTVKELEDIYQRG